MEEINKRLKNIELWLDNMSDKNRETYSLLIKADIEAIKEQLLIHSVGSSLPKVCKGCGSLSTKVIDNKYLACCPDSNYIPMEDYCKNSIYPEKQF